MTYGEILNADNKEAEMRKNEREKEVYETLKNILYQADYEVTEIKIFFQEYEEAGKIEYHFILSDGYEQDDSYYWSWEETVEKASERIKKHIDYIAQLRKQYPEYAAWNDHIQKFREYEKECVLLDRGYERTAKISAELCGYLKLPNTTSCSFGGGDYEIKKTPQRVKDFNENIDKLCLFLADCISELRGLKVKSEVMKDDYVKNDCDRK